ncbi:polynucleotide 5'-hydroxyl-kinase [Malassezia vespertilionis]|uniref:polynucleotide 5'-hydroxyl-kinase n=1 Tax=Malassezia vespertilionis TaxID=2020962 RepID=UPI0024B17BD5|nr:polynucleotide 5'-hydroxyl-kinase [Malassezia vespertilionis]WFD07716.1 polynucleotide 5'-hydroxyl-kinase [Malassezia vespertilionis]
MESRARRIRLPPRAEYRFELEAGEVLSMRFVQDAISGHYGDAEVFGAPLVGGAQERWYTFGNEAKAAISSWGGAEIEIVGTASTEYMADEPSPLYTYGANLHLAAERARIRAREQLRTGKSLIDSLAAQDVATRTEPPSYENMNVSSPSEFYRAAGQGPRIMVVGPESAGKTSLIKFLANYALRSPAIASVEEGQDAQILSRAAPDEEEEEGEEEEQVKPDEAKVMGDITGWWPMVLNLDPNAGAVPVPGCISAIPLSPTPMNCLPSPSPALPYGVTLQTSGALPPAASTVESVVPLVQWLGKENVRENEAHSHRVVDWLAHSVEKRLVKDLRARMSGLLLDMPGVVTGDSRTRYSFIQYCVRAFKVDVLVVLGHEKLNLELTKIFSANADAPQIVKVPKSGGAVDVDDLYKQKVQDLQIRSYFYGMGVPKPQESGLANEDGAPHENSHVFPSHMEPLGGVPTLNPYSFTIPLDLLEIYRVGQDRIAPSSALPIGAERAMDGLQVVKLDPVNSASDLSSLLHSVLVLVEPPRGGGEPGKPDSECERTEDELLGASLVGLVHVYV